MDSLISRQITKRTAETEQNVSNDELISKKAAIEVADAVWCVTGDVNVAKVWDQIKDLPSVQEQRWIPVTERLPEEKDAGILKKLGTSKRSDYVLISIDVNGNQMTSVGCTYDGVWHWDKKYAFPDWEVTAWQPFPEPYKERTDEQV